MGLPVNVPGSKGSHLTHFVRHNMNSDGTDNNALYLHRCNIRYNSSKIEDDSAIGRKNSVMDYKSKEDGKDYSLNINVSNTNHYPNVSENTIGKGNVYRHEYRASNPMITICVELYNTIKTCKNTFEDPGQTILNKGSKTKTGKRRFNTTKHINIFMSNNGNSYLFLHTQIKPRPIIYYRIGFNGYNNIQTTVMTLTDFRAQP